MSTKEILSKYKQIEQNKLLVVIDKKGIEVVITPIEMNPVEDLADIDIFSPETDIDTIGSYSKTPTKMTYETDIITKMLVTTRDYDFKKVADDEIERFSNSDTLDDFNQNNNNIIEVLIQNIKPLLVGTKIRLKDFEDIKYSISKIEKKRAFIDIYKYTLSRE